MVAYIDPGTGSFVLQALVATFAGAAVAVNLHWKKIKRFFSRSRDGERPDDPRAPTPSDD
jgi:hypothetical protein